MSLSANSLRNHALELVRRQVASGRVTKDQLARWRAELGADVVDQLVAELAPKPKKKGTKAPSKKRASSTNT